ncbi:xylosidase/arabinosidase [Leptodontidium sp. MPI-SDFR-AT-0119]|nr:xylosidase/arabinosidase [Leptodontidium sp. MPI-SDFR-AT-0119]
MVSLGTGIEYSNPIIPGFAPDPSVVFVDGTFFLCTSSFHVFPGLPLYASKDLKTWSHIGNALNRHSQLSLQGADTHHVPLESGFGMVATMGIFAPTIRHHRGAFYITATSTRVEGGRHITDNFIITTSNIWKNAWSDPIYFEFEGIDTSLFFDDDDRAYVQGSWMTGLGKQPAATIKQAEINVATGKLLSDLKEIWSGWAKFDTEGPHVYKVWGYYYLLAAEGGTFENHMLTVSRSTNIWGPYENCEANPILTAAGTEEYIQNVGHGELFQDADSEWWAAVLGVRKQADGSLGLGRESFLSPVDWPECGWPTVRQPQMTFERETRRTMEHSTDLVSPPKSPPFVDDVYIRDHDESMYQYSDAGKLISLQPSLTNLSSAVESPTFLGRRQRFLTGTANTHLDLSNLQHSGSSFSAGIALYKDPMRFASLGYKFDTNEIAFHIQNSATGLSTYQTQKLPSSAKELELQIIAKPLVYQFCVKVQGKSSEWYKVGQVEAKDLDARDFTGPMFGLFAHTDTADREHGWVRFRDFLLRSE